MRSYRKKAWKVYILKRLKQTLVVGFLIAVTLVVLGATVGTGISAIDDTGTEIRETLIDSTNKTQEEDVRAEFMKIYNEHRIEQGLSRVEEKQVLVQLGENQSANMAEHDYIGHVQPDTGLNMEQRFQNWGLLPGCRIYTGNNRYYPGAENSAGAISSGDIQADWEPDGEFTISNEEDLARYIFESWWNSPGHREAMMEENVGYAGIGLNITSDGDVYAALEMCS